MAPAVTLADFNGDGLLDFAATRQHVSGTVHVWLNLGGGSFDWVGEFPVGVYPASKRLTTGDFNDDGVLDLLVYINNWPPLYPGYRVLNGNGDGTFQGPRVVGNECAAFFRVTGDFNADGIVDYIDGWNRASVRVSLGNGDGSYQHGPYDYAIGSPLRDLAVGDFNADGYPDVAVVREDHDNVLILLNIGGGAAPGSGGGGAGPDVVIVAMLAAEDAPWPLVPTPSPVSWELSAVPPPPAASLVRAAPQAARDQVLARLRAPRFPCGVATAFFDLNGSVKGAAELPFAVEISRVPTP